MSASIPFSSNTSSTKFSVLNIDNLVVDIRTAHGDVHAVRGVSFAVHAGEALALVGESGCGKTMTALAVMGLLPSVAKTTGAITLENQRIDQLDARSYNKLRGARMGMIFQNPMSAFNPTMRVGEQIAETLVTHRAMPWRDAHTHAVKLLDRMQISDAAARARQYPFEFSGGMLQRAMIAMAVACEPVLLIADEPTTALDVTVQVEVLALLRELQREQKMALLLITHDMGVVANIANRVAVMYAGQIVEQANVDRIFISKELNAAHPYTQGLLRAMPEGQSRDKELRGISGAPPDLLSPPAGCSFYARCDHAMKICEQQQVPEFAIDATHTSRCWLAHPQLTHPQLAGGDLS